MPDMISPEEYAALPPSIQKKYFSSKERLCIAQQSAAQQRKKQQHGKLGWLSSASTSDLKSAARPSTSGGLHSLKPKHRPHDPKLFLVRFDQDTISEEEARWFLTLPEKVRSKRFSREELVTLTAKCQRVLGTASPDLSHDLATRRRSVHRLESSASVALQQPSASLASSVYSRNTNSPTNDKVETKPAESIPKSRVPIEVVEIAKVRNDLHDQNPVEVDQLVATATGPADAEMEILKLYLQRGISKVTPKQENAKRAAPQSPPVASSQPPKRRSPHRMHMLTPLPLPPPILAPAPRPRTTSAPMSARLSRPFVNTDPLLLESRPSSDSDAHSSDNQLTKLMVEGTVFELQGGDVVPLPSATRADAPPVSAFSDYESDAEDKDDDMLDTESVETIGPRTPSPTTHDTEAAINSASSDSGIDLPELHLDARPKRASTLDRSSSVLSRHTLGHRSISSRELRTSSEDMLYSFQRRQTSGVEVITEDDPLALEILPVCDDATGAKGAFARDGQVATPPAKGLRKVLSSFRRPRD